MELLFEGLEFVREDGKVFSVEDLLELHKDQPEITEILTKMKNEIENIKQRMEDK